MLADDQKKLDEQARAQEMSRLANLHESDALARERVELERREARVKAMEQEASEKMYTAKMLERNVKDIRSETVEKWNEVEYNLGESQSILNELRPHQLAKMQERINRMNVALHTAQKDDGYER